MSIWIDKKIVKSEERYVRLLIDDLLMAGEDQREMMFVVVYETRRGERFAMEQGEFFKTFDRTEHVDLIEAYYGG